MRRRSTEGEGLWCNVRKLILLRTQHGVLKTKWAKSVLKECCRYTWSLRSMTWVIHKQYIKHMGCRKNILAFPYTYVVCVCVYMYTYIHTYIHRLPWWLSGKEYTCQWRRHRFDPWVGMILWRRKWQPKPVFLPRKSHGQRSLVGYSPWGHKSQTWLSD